MACCQAAAAHVGRCGPGGRCTLTHCSVVSSSGSGTTPARWRPPPAAQHFVLPQAGSGVICRGGALPRFVGCSSYGCFLASVLAGVFEHMHCVFGVGAELCRYHLFPLNFVPYRSNAA